MQRITDSHQQYNYTTKFPLATPVLEYSIQSEFGQPHWSLDILNLVKISLICNMVQVFASLLHCFSLKIKRYKNRKAVKEE